MNLTFVDILVGLVLAVSTFYAAWRGFLHETLAIFAVVAAVFAALYFGPWLFPWMHQHIATEWLAGKSFLKPAFRTLPVHVAETMKGYLEAAGPGFRPPVDVVTERGLKARIRERVVADS